MAEDNDHSSGQVLGPPGWAVGRAPELALLPRPLRKLRHPKHERVRARLRSRLHRHGFRLALPPSGGGHVLTRPTAAAAVERPDEFDRDSIDCVFPYVIYLTIDVETPEYFDWEFTVVFPTRLIDLIDL